MKLFKFFKGHGLAMLICLVLLIIQANLELSLPRYMSDIVDVGLQQNGIESPVPQRIRATELADLELFMSEADAQKVDAVYGSPDAEGLRHFDGTKDESAADGEIASILTLPECVVLSLEDGIELSQLSSTSLDRSISTDEQALSAATPEQLAALREFQEEISAHDGKLTLNSVKALYEAGLVSREELVSAGVAMNDALGQVASTMLSQRAITFVAREYEAQGIDLAAVQHDYLMNTALIMFGLCLGTLVVTILVGFVASRTAATIARNTRRALFNQVMRFSPAEVNKFSQASLITRTTNDLQQIQIVCVVLLRMVLLAPIMGIVAFLQVTATRSGMEWIIGVALLAILVALGLLFGMTMPKFKRIQSLIDRLNLVSRDMLDGLMPLRVFGREDYELHRFDGASTDLMKTQLFVNRAMSFMMPVIMLVMNLITLLIVWVGAQGVDMGNIQVGTMMAFITYTMQIVMSFMILGMVAIMLPRAQVSAERVSAVIECPLSIITPDNAQVPDKTKPRGVVEFRQVGFRYPDAEKAVLSDISFTTAAGKTLGIIGSTGSGKSTLVKLIPRLYDATQGSVLVDGVDVRAMDLNDLRRRVGYVPQQGFLFSGTIGSNISFGDRNMPKASIEQAASIAQATEFIEKSPERFQTPIAQKGVNVSGGQRQRLSIARALAIHPEILVFDDSFSALDYTTDAQLRENLKTGADGAAVIIVAQRVATIMHADEILVLDNGVMVGQGDHQSLLESCDAYREIALSQLSAEELGLQKSSRNAAFPSFSGGSDMKVQLSNEGGC